MRRLPSLQSRFFATLVAAAIATAPLHVAHAAPTVEELYTQGQEKFDASEYGDAGDLWGQAVQLLPEDKDNSATRQTIMNLALDAYLRAYRSDKDRSHIDDAKALLADYEAALEGSDVELSPEIADEKSKIEGILAELAAAEAAEEDEPEVIEAPIVEPDPLPVTNEKPGRGLVIGGAALLGVGAVGLGLAIGGAVGSKNVQALYDDADAGSPEKADYDTRGKTLNALGITGAVIAPLFLGAGVALLIIGLKKNKRASQNQVMVLPSAGPEYVGLGFTGRF